MNLKHVQAELAGLGFKTVAGIAGLADFERTAGPLPAAYVIAGAESGVDAAQGSQVFEQVVSVGFTAVTVTATGGPRNERPIDELDELRRKTKAALFGWQHPESTRPTAFTGASDPAVGGGRTSQQLRFRLTERLRTIA